MFFYFHLGFRPILEKNKLPGIKNIDPYSGPKSGMILTSLLTKNINDLSFDTIKSEDRKIISSFLWNLLCYHFEGLVNLKSMRVARKILNDVNFMK